MQSTQPSTKGKGKAKDGGSNVAYKKSFAALSLSGRGDSPSAYASLYPDSYGSSYDPTYNVNGQYGLTDQSLLSTNSSSTSYGDTPVYSSSFAVTPATNPLLEYWQTMKPVLDMTLPVQPRGETPWLRQINFLFSKELDEYGFEGDFEYEDFGFQ